VAAAEFRENASSVACGTASKLISPVMRARVGDLVYLGRQKIETARLAEGEEAQRVSIAHPTRQSGAARRVKSAQCRTFSQT
jgi:hypothetical protein